MIIDLLSSPRFHRQSLVIKGWNPPQVAYELLRRTYQVIKDVRNTN